MQLPEPKQVGWEKEVEDIARVLPAGQATACSGRSEGQGGRKIGDFVVLQRNSRSECLFWERVFLLYYLLFWSCYCFLLVSRLPVPSDRLGPVPLLWCVLARPRPSPNLDLILRVCLLSSVALWFCPSGIRMC